MPRHSLTPKPASDEDIAALRQSDPLFFAWLESLSDTERANMQVTIEGAPGDDLEMRFDVTLPVQEWGNSTRPWTPET